MIIRPRGYVTIPNRPRSIAELLGWGRGVTQALKQLRDRSIVIPSLAGGQGPTTKPKCPFGEIITTGSGEETAKAIRGGLFQCGDKNFSVPDKVLDLEEDGKWFIHLKLADIECATDDNEEIFLPGGIETTTAVPVWHAKEWVEGEHYDSTTNPTSPAETGQLTVPIGILTIVEGVPTLAEEGCGKIIATQCGGLMNHTRGEPAS